ncbi:MAG: histidine kinase, partial [Bacteroidota bacterium]
AHTPPPLVVRPSVSYLTLEFTVPDLTEAGPRRYQTRLVGFDPDWRASSTTPSVRYTRLPPGNYVFQLKATDGQGRAATEIREMQITVSRPWYQQLWFFILCLFLASLLAYLVFQYQLRRKTKRLEAERKLMALELRSLRLQLNPHFLSNAMNAIRETIRQQRPALANEYLLDFNRLMRLFLESSRKRFTPLEEEVEMLRKYVRLEQLRFPNTFEVKFFIDPVLKSGMDEIPSLILQPIVENAIIHGLAPLKEGGGLLTISFNLEEPGSETIVCIITDNGIGRKLAAKSTARDPKHISRATEIINDRLRLIEQDPSLDIEITTDDLHPERERTGTVVRVRIVG